MLKVSKCGVFSGLYFPAFGLNAGNYSITRFTLFSANGRKHRPEKTTDSDTFHAVISSGFAGICTSCKWNLTYSHISTEKNTLKMN